MTGTQMRFSVLVILVLVAMSAAPVAAQSAEPQRFDIAAGYAFMRDQDIANKNPDISANFPAGWMASVGGQLWQGLGIAGEVRGSYKTISIAGDQPKVRVYTFMAGPRARLSHSRIAPFGQVLFGAARASTSVLSVIDTVTNFAYQPGGGVDLKVSGGLGVRLEADYRIIRSGGKNSKEPAFVIAARFRF